jgi:hypothetical protein
MNAKFIRIEVLVFERLLVWNGFGLEWFWCCLCLVHGKKMVNLA